MKLFPYSKVRDVQAELIKDVEDAIVRGKNLIAHAPTGLGKTASTLPIALHHAIENDLSVFFLTNRHTQHRIAIDTLKDIKKAHDVKFLGVDIIGKKWMCSQDNINELYTNEFMTTSTGSRFARTEPR